MVRLLWLAIEKFRSIAPTKLVFSDSFNVLLGRNATGKTTLLNLIACAASNNFRPFIGEEFSITYSVRRTEARYEIAVQNIPHSESPAAATTSAPPKYRLSGSVQIFPDSLPPIAVSFSGARVTVTRENETVTSSIENWGSREGALDIPALAAVRALGTLQAGHYYNYLAYALQLRAPGRRFDESLDTLHAFEEGAFHFYLGAVESGIRRDISYDWEIRETLGPDCAGQLIDSLWSGTTDRALVPARQLPFLNRLIQILEFNDAALDFDIIERRPGASGSALVTFGRGRFHFMPVPLTLWQHQFLSYGQQRLLAFLLYLEGADIVVADELVNGLHHAWIAAALESIGERQSFLTSQNPLLLDYLPVESAEQAGKMFLLCRGNILLSDGAVTWRNMSVEEARSFYEAYKVGIQHVSEILQDKGLW